MNDNDFHKGAFEEDNPHDHAQVSLKGQLPHRNQEAMIKAADTDFPEPGENPEHSGEPEVNPEGDGEKQDPGEQPKRSA